MSAVYCVHRRWPFPQRGIKGGDKKIAACRLTEAKGVFNIVHFMRRSEQWGVMCWLFSTSCTVAHNDRIMLTRRARSDTPFAVKPQAWGDDECSLLRVGVGWELKETLDTIPTGGTFAAPFANVMTQRFCDQQ